MSVEKFNRMSPTVNKVLHEDGSLTTYDNQPIVQSTATDKFNRMSPNKNELLNQDGTTTTWTELITGGGGDDPVTQKWEGTLLAGESVITGLVDLPDSNSLEYQFVLGGVIQEPVADYTVDHIAGTLTIIGVPLTDDVDWFLIYRSVAIPGIGDVNDLKTDSKEVVGAINENYDKIQNLSDFENILAITDIYNVDIKNYSNKNIDMETLDAVAKTISLANIPTRCELFIELKYTNDCAITWFNGITWLSGFAPEFYVGKTYRLAFSTNDGGTNWHGSYTGGW